MGQPAISIMAARQDWLGPHLTEADNTQLHGLYIADHPSFDVTDSWSWLAFAAARTKRLKLGTHVTGAPFHHPLRLAKQVVTVDVLSGGRAVLGLGTAYEVQDFKPYGFDMGSFRERLTYTEEMIQVMERLFTGSIDGFDGQFLRFAGKAEFAPRPVNNRVPIWFGLNKPGLALKSAARLADAINTWQLSPDQVRLVSEQLESELAVIGKAPGSVALTSDVLMVPGGTEADATKLASQIQAMARSWGRKDSVTDWHAGGVLYGDIDSMAEQALSFGEVGVSELSVSVGNMDEVAVVAELAARLAR